MCWLDLYSKKIYVIESSSAENSRDVLVDEKLNMNGKFVLTDQKADCILGCIKRSMASRSRDEILPLHSALARPHLGYCVQLWGPRNRKDMDLMNQVQRKATKIIRGQHTSPLRTG